MDPKKSKKRDSPDKSPEKPISVEAAEKILSAFPVCLLKENVPLLAAQNRILAEGIFSPIDMPEFDKSAMDGYAYGSADTAKAFRIVETIAAGVPPRLAIAPGQCAKIMTGAMVPAGADRVVKRECTAEKDGYMQITAVDRNSNIRRQGEDLRTGQRVLPRGTRLRPAQIALLASLGMAEIPATRQARVGIITTGSELVEPGTDAGPGKIYNSNFYSLAAQISAAGALPLSMGYCADDLEPTAARITAALTQCDMLLLSGGVSAGDFDFVPAAMKMAGISLEFQKIAVQPGMPTVFGRKDSRIVFGLPGNPVSTFIIFEVFVKPLLMRLLGHDFRPLLLKASLEKGYHRAQAARSVFLPVVYRDGLAAIVAYHGSAHLHALSLANALLYVPAGLSDIPAGSTVDVRYL